ncbi:Uu.00g071610.m01.CDS01 [Anthostomella pinea]|uniref:Uu.00g071610.m01.CDS01 n=1 Tax=Anthostomella pinea TaxID=933095 RepID=A0AAI8VUY7_9PEZI|nr:Uu.00g071610.m01.CDS01 [Anthostomella pinea]
MRFGKTLRESIYSPWKDQYLDYAKLKAMLREDVAEDEDVPWTEEDENRFCDEIFNVQLEKVAQFKANTVNSLKERAEAAFEQLRDMTPSEDGQKSDITTARMKELKGELDSIINEVKELKKYSSLNYTGFLKIVKKHDRKRGDRYKVRPMMRVSLSQHGFNSEQAYSPLLTKLSMMYYAINQNLEEGEPQQPLDLEHQQEVHNGERYTAHKFWVHPDNLLEVKTAILRHLPSLVYSQQSAKELDGNDDPKITSVYFDNSKLDLYGRKVGRQVDASSLRLRWYGQLSAKPDIVIEQKIIHDNGSSEEKKFNIKDKYIKQFLDGEYKMEKSVQKMERQGQPAEAIESFKTTAGEIQDFIISRKIGPVLRANYTRTAFQKPLDDRVRISIDTDIAFIREDTLDRSRPCRDPQDWHRTDIDNSNMTYPFKNINQSEVSRFPYPVLEIKSKEEEGRKRPGWIEDLMASHLVHAAPRFSKFVHGVASLFDDYVNNLPFWLSDLETDIRKDPQIAHDQEEQRKAQRAEDAQVVGSFLGTGSKGASYKPTASSPFAKSYLSDRAAADARASESQAPNGRGEPTVEEEDGEEGNDAQSNGPQRGYGTLSSVFPGFSLSRYSRAKRQRAQLPEGVTKPETWIKNAGPLQIEPKVWLANERTFLKWQHICILLGTLAISLYTAAGENFLAECMGIAYIAIAALAGLWGYYMLQRRRSMIMERSGKDFDNMIGPLVVSVAMMLALILNFVFAYRAAFSKLDADGKLFNSTTTEAFVGELI